jgi:hypothetical protein
MEQTAQELRAELAKREYAELQECIQQLQQMAASLGFEIIAIPQLTQDGRLTAQWGVRRAQG